MAIIEFRNVSKKYLMGEVTINALHDASFTINKGELVCILGPSGAGKTTCLNILGGMDSPTFGDVIVDGVNISILKGKNIIKYRRKDIGFVFQFYNLVSNLTAIENVELAVQLTKDHLEPKEALKLVGLENRLNNFPSQLSGGEQQRVALARALVNNPSMIIADEPTGNLDPETAWEIMSLLNDINARGTTVVVATHAKDIVDKMKKRVIQIEKGNIIRDDKKGGYDSEI